MFEHTTEGGSLAWAGGDYLYALGGDRSKEFWRYDINSGEWESQQDTPEVVDDGGALVYLNGVIYALKGDNGPGFWRLGTVVD